MVDKYISNYSFKDIELLSAWINRKKDDEKRNCLCLTYGAVDKNGNEYIIVIPKIYMPFISMHTLPRIFEDYSYVSGTTDVYIQLSDDKLEILPSSGTVYDYDGKAVEYTDAKIIIIPKKDNAPKKMTLSEIEKELGYKIDVAWEKILKTLKEKEK